MHDKVIRHDFIECILCVYFFSFQSFLLCVNGLDSLTQSVPALWPSSVYCVVITSSCVLWHKVFIIVRFVVMECS